MTTPQQRVFDRIPNTPDDRDWKMSDHLDPAAMTTSRRTDASVSLDAVDTAVALMHSHHVAKSTQAFAVAVAQVLHAIVGGSPSPPSPPVPTVVFWPDDKPQLDQASTGHCVGFGWAQWSNTAQAVDPDLVSFAGYNNDDGHAIYYECKVIDNEPNEENGSQVRSGAIAMQNRGVLANYVFADTIDDMIAWLLTKGPVVVGTDWMSGMDDPDSHGLVTIDGYVRGGHCFVAVGYDPATEWIKFHNSWGNWGKGGYFFMLKGHFATLLSRQGDACGALESAA